MSSKSKQVLDEEQGRQSGIQSRNFVITRTDPRRSNASSVFSSSRSSYGVRSSISPGVYQQLSSSGITDFKGNREKEKREMQNLNERLASYIEKVHFLDAQVKKLEAENEALRNRKVEDLQPIRDAYENELRQARKVIDELSSTKGVAEAKLAGLLDEIASLRALIVTYEGQGKDYRKKIDTLTNQLGEFEGELQSLRLRVGSLEDENAKLRELLEKVQEQNRRLRSDLDAETAAHIEADCLAQTKTEEAEFYKDLLDQLELLKPEPIQIKGMDYADFWKSELAKCVREINLAYDEKIDLIQQDCEAKYAAQINQLRSGNVKDGMQLQHAQEEVKKLRGQLQDKNTAYAELATRIASLQAERDELARQLSELERELEEQRIKYNHDVGDLESELTSVLAQLQHLMDAKMSLELEIACYKKLLEGEESRVGLRSLVEQAIGTAGKGASNLKEVIQSSTLKESTGSLTVQRSSKGTIGFASIDHSGGNVVIENTTSGARAKNQSLKDWVLQKLVNNKVSFEIKLKDLELGPGRTYTIWAKGAKDKATADNEQVADQFSFGVGTCTWKLLDESSNEKATLVAKFSG
ncbi:retrograde protein of 51 kDa isoform X2 [Biomphalaria glabrata]|uniref:Intermediate filament protein n=1 Tax=Biomphalaria glabrata TaxID=6526 RepID=Q45RT7_BIOGL|nr:retrograde protein of 51 kDa [Biomphalaria glabrata]XP_013073862.1 retrograde protein of 51 kDa isoform X2 [Biomphalaria glabrata]AAZ39528.1 intermediate filament protein [Biomphalaria glabrata]KAI8779492.1 retrograde protein of 51 kDa [Biomphalaria glabrata]